MNIRNRVKELRRVKASELLPNPKNWRTHPKAQQDALRGVLAEVGMADACLARELDDGSLMLIDGHLRAETIGEEVVPVLILDVDEVEADKILATLDPLAAMAVADKIKLSDLASSVTATDETLKTMLAGMIQDLQNVEKPQPSQQLAPSNVRMVQLFFDETTIKEFTSLCGILAEHYDTTNITETVLATIEDEIA